MQMEYNTLEDGLSIIIVNYYSETMIENLIVQITDKIKIPKYEILISNNSENKFHFNEEYIKSRNIKFFENKSNLGFGLAVNIAAENAKYKIICLCNPDISLNGEVVNYLYRRISESDKEVGSCGCIEYDSDHTIQQNFFMNKQLEFNTFLIENIRAILPSYIRRYFPSKELEKKTTHKKESDYMEVGGFYCSFVFFKTKYFLEKRGFDPDFFMYSEDIDLFRNRFREYKSILFKNVNIVHNPMKCDKYGIMKRQAQVSYLLYLRKTGLKFVAVYFLIYGFKYSIIKFLSLFGFKRYDDESDIFFASFKYLKDILFVTGYGKLEKPFKIKEVQD